MVVSRSVWVGPMPLNSAKLPSPCRKKRSIGIMRSMALSSAGGGAMLRAVNAVRSGSRSTSNSMSAPGLRLMWPPSGRICRASSSPEPLGGGADVALLARPCTAPRRSARSRPGGAARRRALPTRCAAGGGPGGSGCAGSGDRTARRNRRAPSGAWLSHEMTRRATTSARQAIGSCELLSVIHSSTSARALARVMPDSAARRWRSQPKPSSATAQSSDGGGDLERRTGIADHDLAGEHEAAGIDLARAGRVGGAQVLRRDDEAVGLAERERPVDDRMRRDAAERACERGRAPGTRTVWYVPRPKRATSRRWLPSRGGPPHPTRANPVRCWIAGRNIAEAVGSAANRDNALQILCSRAA